MVHLTIAFLFTVFVPQAVGKLGNPRGVHHTARAGAGALQDALDALLGCGGNNTAERDHLVATQEALRSTWNTLPKDSFGQVEWQSLRYVAHRYFAQRFGVTVRGFEPGRLVNASHKGHADVLHKHVPHFVELLSDERNEPRSFLTQSSSGFSLEDAAALVLTIEHLIFDAETAALEDAYAYGRVEAGHRISKKDLHKVLEKYIVMWLLGDDKESVALALNDPSVLDNAFPHWKEIRKFLEGQVRALDFERRSKPRSHTARSVMSGTYTFDDAHAVIGSVTQSFGSFWESECRTMKNSLVEMDTEGTGRVRLSKFYGTALSSEDRFGESESYLRDLGVLDESRGKEVRIANYMQAASNCIVTAPNYYVCCKNECEDILDDIEAATRAPASSPKDILNVVRNISTREDDAVPAFDGTLSAQLEKIAQLHGGVVPIHGRLFAQWLHYAYPRECAFPHKAGTHKHHAPSEYGDNYVASQSEMRVHASYVSNNSSAATEEADEESWISQQWSDEDEVLLAGNSVLLRAPWEGRRSVAHLGGALAAVLVAAWLAFTWNGGKQQSVLPTSSYDSFAKSHLV